MNWIPSLAGLAVTIFMIPISAGVGKVLAQARRDLIKATDARVKAATEIITGGWPGVGAAALRRWGAGAGVLGRWGAGAGGGALG
jgi:hypothetical protein